ncbi:hypothetical protein ACFYNM_39475 [Streptomyces spororaveus]|uniref:hypothetical protein n=1 Tax=Streptomyces spororaveus TaxID=284039 RepID=UPI00369CBE99
MITATRLGRESANGYITVTTEQAATSDGDLDLIAIELAVNGQHPQLTEAEALEAARILTDRGVGPTATAQRLGVPLHRIYAWRDRNWTTKSTGRPTRKESAS